MSYGVYFRNADTNTVALFGPVAGGRREFATVDEWDVWRSTLPITGLVPPSDREAITGLSPAMWFLVCAIYAG